MLDREQRVAALRDANQRRQETKRRAVEEALAAMLKQRQKVSVSAVAKAAAVSRNFIYQHEDLLTMVEQSAASRSERMAQPRVTSSEASLRNRLADALDALREAKEDNKRLQAKIERLTGELAREVEHRAARRSL